MAFYWPVGNWVPYLLFPRGAEMARLRCQQHWDRLLVLGFAVLQLLAIYALKVAAEDWDWARPVRLVGVFFLGIVPYLMWSYSIAVVDLIHHTHPRAVWFASRAEWDYYTANVRSTTHMVLPFGLGRLLHNILDHTAHHVDPRIPLYHLPEAQAALESTYPQDVPVERLTVRYVLRLLRTCRLYDYQKRQWLDYDGTPTGPAQRPDENPEVVGHPISAGPLAAPVPGPEPAREPNTPTSAIQPAGGESRT
jgi:omega-6 fatty acid desaturase (delta-12 desaturase)